MPQGYCDPGGVPYAEFVPVGHSPETTLHQYGLRFYSPKLGRWVSRDPIRERGEEYSFVRNNSVDGTDYLGLWLTEIYKDRTTELAGEEGYSSQSAVMIGERDESVDGAGTGPSPIPSPGIMPIPATGDQSYHFNTAASGDSRLDHADTDLQAAKDACDWAKDNDDYLLAAKKMGFALHARQDWVAHGDFPGGVDWHNFNGPFIPGLSGALAGGHAASSPYNMQYYPDTAWMDAQGSYADVDGRAAGLVVRATNKAQFQVGSKRAKKNDGLTKQDLQDFFDHVKSEAKDCGKCRTFYLTNDAICP